MQDSQYARLLEEVPDIVVVLDGSGNLLWANLPAQEMFAQPLEEVLGTSALEFVHPDDVELALRSLESIQGKEVGNPLELRVRIGSEWRLIELVGRPVGWLEEGAIVFSLRDLTGRRRFEVARNDVGRIRSLVHNATSIILLVSASGLIESVSGAFTRNLGHDPELVEGRPLADLVAPPDRRALADAFAKALQGATATNPVTVGVGLTVHASDETVAYELSIVNLVDDATVGGLVVTAHDVSARVNAERELQSAMIELRDTFSLLNATLDSTANGILVVGRDRRIMSFNRQFAEMWQIPTEILESGDDVKAMSYVMEQLDDPETFATRIEDLYARPHAESKDTFVLKDGRVYERLSKPQLLGGAAIGRVWSFFDVSDQKRLEAELEHLAFHDHLTGLANRALFKDRLDQAVARSGRTGKYVAVLFLDVDNFKTINDSLGHSAGDQLLMGAATAIGGCLRASDTAARIGGDEFAILVEDIDSQHSVLALADRIIDALRIPIYVERQKLAVTVSMGITFGVVGDSSDELLSNADLAMYTAKLQGKNRVVQFEAHMHTAVLARLELEADIRRAVAEDEFTVYYQPIVELERSTIVGLEALVRWEHPTRGLLEPSSFIEFAEEIGLVDDIDRLVLTKACVQASRWQEAGLAPRDFRISVNLSAREVVDAGVGPRVEDTLRATGFDPVNLILEITESAVMNDMEAAIRNLNVLTALGVRIAIDDFGTGYSSLSQLERLPIDILKIDKSFLTSVVSPGDAADLARAIVQLSVTLGITAIAEGIENDAQRSCLLAMGCRLGQGYYLGRPVPRRRPRSCCERRPQRSRCSDRSPSSRRSRSLTRSTGCRSRRQEACTPNLRATRSRHRRGPRAFDRRGDSRAPIASQCARSRPPGDRPSGAGGPSGSVPRGRRPAASSPLRDTASQGGGDGSRAAPRPACRLTCRSRTRADASRAGSGSRCPRRRCSRFRRRAQDPT